MIFYFLFFACVCALLRNMKHFAEIKKKEKGVLKIKEQSEEYREFNLEMKMISIENGKE